MSSDTQLTEALSRLMHDGTDGLSRVDLVDTALARARRVRRNRRIGAGLAAAALVAAAVAVPTTLIHGAGADRPVAPSHDGKPPAGPRTFRAPALDPAIKAPALDLARLDALPTASTWLPGQLTPGGATGSLPGRAVMVTKQRAGDQRLFYALDTDDRWHRVSVDAPADIGNGLGPMLDPTSLSPDGTKVALRGARTTYVVDLGSGKTRRFASSGGTRLWWQGDSRHLLLTGGQASRVVDVDTGAAATVDVGSPVGGSLAATYAGKTLVDVVSARGGTAFAESTDGIPSLLALRAAGDSYDVAGLLVDPTAPSRLVATATPVFGQGKECCGDAGLLLLSRPGYTGTAFLPVRGSGQDVQPGSELLARTWLSPREVLFSVSPRDRSGSAPTEYYLVWDTSSGAVSRLGAVDQLWRDSSWATGLFGDHGG